MKKTGLKNPWILLILMLAGIVLGGFVGTLTENIAALNWLNYGQSFGIDSPIVLNPSYDLSLTRYSISTNHVSREKRQIRIISKFLNSFSFSSSINMLIYGDITYKTEYSTI